MLDRTRLGRTFRRLTGLDLAVESGDFRLMDRRLVEALKSLPERNRFMKGLYAWVGFRSVAVDYVPDERFAGPQLVAVQEEELVCLLAGVAGRSAAGTGHPGPRPAE